MSYRSATTPGRLLTEAALMECAGGCYSQPQVCGAVRLTLSPREWKWIVVAQRRSDRTAIKLQETVIPNKRIFQGEKSSKRNLVKGRSHSLACEQKHTRTHILHTLRLSFLMAHLCHSKNPLSTGYHFIPLVVQHVHVTIRLVAADIFRHVASERGVLGQPDSISWKHKEQQLYTYSSARPMHACGVC